MATYFVSQASGQQAQWTVTHLLAAGAKIHALVRSPENKPAILDNPNVTVFKGESTNYDQVLEAAKGCKAAYLNTFPIPGLETQQAQTIVDACKAAGVQSVVALTTMYTDKRSYWDNQPTRDAGLFEYWESKAAVEHIVRKAGFSSYTILRPAFIHFDFMLPSAPHNFARFTEGIIDHGYDDNARMGYTDASDVGTFAAAALQDPGKFAGAEFMVARDALTITEVRDVIERATGRSPKLNRLTHDEIEACKAYWSGNRFHVWANHHDVSGLPEAADATEAKFGIPLGSLENALKRDADRVRAALPA